MLDAARSAGGELVMFLEDAAKIREQAQQVKLAALGRLTANIAHEIRNPLSAIGHAAELLGEEGRADPRLARLTRIIGDNTARLDRIVQEVLQLNRRDRALAEEIALPAFVRSIVEQISQAEHIPAEAFQVNAPPACGALFDRQHLDRILWNLITNAWRHSRQVARSIWIDVGASDEGRVELHIVDDGPGVDGELAAQLFEPFFTTAARGTGLGLYIARELAEANGAALEFVPAADREPRLRERAGAGGADFKLVMKSHA
jgi:two-component system sensor histidine kinase PilS (NtrC family)